MLEDAFGAAVQAPVAHCAHFFDNPIKPGAVYPCLYINKYEFECVSPPAQCAPFVVIRDLRDTLVSGYFSWRYSHRIEWYPMEKCRRVLNSLNVEAGMIYMLHEFLPKPALMQESWLGSGTRLWKLEDFMGDPATQTRELLNYLGIPVDSAYAKTLSDRHSFKRLSSGRSPGEEDAASHFRKGIAGDWRTHFTPEVTKQFKHLYNDLLVRAGYERDDNW
jgi:lipopolysaccharide transport system ATP-binding protein